MALSDEQRAMLQLLLEGGQGYEDIGSLLGIAPDEVRTRARDALREMGGADPDAQVGLSDYLLGQADPIGRADAVRHLQNDPEANALAERLLTQLRLLAPKAQLPDIPAARGGRRAATPSPPPPAAAPEMPPAAGPAPPAAPTPPKGPGFASRIAGFFSGLGGGGKRRTQLIVAGVAALALTVAVVVVAASGSDDGEQTAEDCPTVDSTQAQQAGLPTIPLEAPEAPPEGECAPSGLLTLVATKKELGIQINAVGLEPTAQDEAYLVWLFQSDQQSIPVAAQPSPDGNLTTTAPVAQELATLIASGAFSSVRVSRASQSEAQTAAQAVGQGKQQSPVIPFFGATVLEGPLPQPQQGQGGGQAPQGQQGQAPQGQGQAPQGGQGGAAGQ